MRPSMPMSPTLAMFGLPPRAMTAQFSNSNGGISRSCFSLLGRSRITKSLPSVRRQSVESRFAMTRQAVGDTSIPIHLRRRFCAETSAVPHPQNASRTMSPLLLLAPTIRSSKARGFCVG